MATESESAAPNIPQYGTNQDTVTFTLKDPEEGRLTSVRLWQEVRIPGDRLAMTWSDGAWTLTIPRPAVDRMEYLFELTHADGGQETICDPANPLRVGGAFGDHSVHQFPEYRLPAWLPVVIEDAGRFADLDVPADGIAHNITGCLWTSGGLDDDTPAGLIVAHDGPEYDQLADLTRYLSAEIALGALPPLRVALLAPGPRDEWYSASGAYGRALTRSRRAASAQSGAPVTQVVGMGASLGALEMLVAHRSAPNAFDGLFLQSGSYFQPGLDDQERSFSEFQRIARSVGGVLASAGSRRPVPTVLTCGGIEENLGNNRAMLRALTCTGVSGRTPRGARRAQLHRLARRLRPVPDPPTAPSHGNGLMAETWHGDPQGGFSGHVRSYGHWGRPVLAFPAEAGSAGDWESNGMVDAVSGLLNDGRIKLYCVDSADAQTWSDRSLPYEERARMHEVYERWLLNAVVPFIAGESGGRTDLVATGVSLGAFHAANIVSAARGSLPGRSLHVGQLRPVVVAHVG